MKTILEWKGLKISTNKTAAIMYVFEKSNRRIEMTEYVIKMNDNVVNNVTNESTYNLYYNRIVIPKIMKKCEWILFL